MISDGQPSPSSFFVMRGTVPMHAASYVQRKADTDLLTALQGGRLLLYAERAGIQKRQCAL